MCEIWGRGGIKEGDEDDTIEEGRGGDIDLQPAISILADEHKDHYLLPSLCRTTSHSQTW